MSCCSEPELVYVLARSTVTGWSRLCLKCAYESEPGAVGPMPDPSGPAEVI